MKPFSNPTVFPTVWTLFQTKRDVFVADAETYTVMKMNSRAVDEIDLYRRFVVGGKKPLTVEDVKASLATGAAFRQPLETQPDPDYIGAMVPCLSDQHPGHAGEEFSPVVYKTPAGLRGSFAEFRRDDVIRIVENELFRAELISRLEKTTLLIYPDGRIPHEVLVGSKHPSCARADRPRTKKDRNGKEYSIPGDTTRYLPFRDVHDDALRRDQGILDAKGRNARRKGTIALFDRKSKRGGGKPSSDREGRGGYQRRTDERPRSQWHGANFLEDTVKALAKTESEGKLTGGLNQLAEASDEFLRTTGIAVTERAVNAVRTIARKTMERAEATRVAEEVLPSISTTSAPTHLGDVARMVEAKPKPSKKNKKDGWDRKSRRNSVDDGE